MSMDKGIWHVFAKKPNEVRNILILTLSGHGWLRLVPNFRYLRIQDSCAFKKVSKYRREGEKDRKKFCFYGISWLG